jgi:DNA-binding response OmpR family regulator
MKRVRVLVVDDEPQILRALETNLRAAGYEVLTAETAEQALSATALQRPDAVILDLVLPDGRGTDVAASSAAGARYRCSSSRSSATRQRRWRPSTRARTTT